MQFYAHTHPDFPNDRSKWEPLFTPFGEAESADPSQTCTGQNAQPCPHCQSLHPQHGHLNKVAHLAATFAANMFPPGENRESARQWGYLSGLWHDLGKFAPKWQKHLTTKSDPHADDVVGKEDHSTAGAQFSEETVPHLGLLLSYPIAGHHAGLANGIDASNSSLDKRLTKIVSDTSQAPTDVLGANPKLPLPPCGFQSGHSLGFFVRMLFSALVDADFLATESFMSPLNTLVRPPQEPAVSFVDLEACLSSRLQRFGPPKSPVNRARADILSHCLDKAEQRPGIFSLAVPTGGGKTLASLAFALKHARQHDLRRIIYVIPFTSIIEQNAAVFREVFAALGDDIVLEHHSNLDPDADHQTSTSRLSAENWDARIIVTTNVQFFESLHANRTSRCRKLHRIARSVVIFDEVQTLPTPFLLPCLRAIEELTRSYGTTAVLCSATQPAIEKNESFPDGLRDVLEIIPEPASLYQNLRRVTAEHLGKPLSNPEIIDLLQHHPQVLCIVNTRRQARELFELLPDDGSRFHLSALMCPEHRTARLEEIKSRLQANRPIRLISTQLIEAGVDIDFPVVFRALAGLDSIAQAAGRCDREGKLTAEQGAPAGKIFIFEPDQLAPPGFIRSSADSAKEVFSRNPPDPLALDCIESYFRTHYWKHSDLLDQKNILSCWPDLNQRAAHLTCEQAMKEKLLGFEFKRCAADFKLIDDYSEPVIVPYGKKGRDLCDQLAETFDPAELRYLARKLQRFTVAIPKPQHLMLVSAGILKPLHEERYHVLNSDPHYSDEFGLHPHPDKILPPHETVL